MGHNILDYPRSPLKERLKGFIYRGWDHYLAAGSRAREYLLSLRIPSESITICGNPVDSHFWENAVDRTEQTSAQRNFLFVERPVWQKNVRALLEAYRDYRRLGGSFNLALAGFEASDFENEALPFDQPGVRLLGCLPEKRLVEAYGQAGCLVLPSLVEPWGLVVNEAMHTGLPAIVSSVCGCVPELLQNRRSGLIVDPRRTQDIPRALLEFSQLSTHQRRMMAQSAQLAVSEQTPEAWSRKAAEALQSLPGLRQSADEPARVETSTSDPDGHESVRLTP
jgi:1,2-diacylglycerol 3-alpha-glucosyltransferase